MGRDKVADSGVRGLGLKSPGSILTSGTETSSLSRVVRDGGDTFSVPLCGGKKSLTVEYSTRLLNSHNCSENYTKLLLLLLLLLKKFGSARLGESDIHPISPKTPAPQYQPIDRKKRKGKRVEDYSRARAA